MKGLKSLTIEHKKCLPEQSRSCGISYLSTPEMVRYYECYTGLGANLLSIYRESQTTPLLSLIYTASDNKINFFGMPCEIAFHEVLSFKQMKKSVSFLFQELKSNYESYSIEFKHNEILNSFLSSTPYLTETNFTGTVNLTLSEQEILQSFRKSYRSLINWGKKNLEVRTLQRDIKQRDIELFQQFHISVAGRETRSAQTWDLQKELVQNGLGWINLAYMSDRLVSANLIIHDHENSYYAVAVSDRNLMEKENLPLAHVLIESSIFKAKEVGLKSFDFGDIRQKNENSQKENSIRKFKSGFCNHYRLENTLVISLRDIQ